MKEQRSKREKSSMQRNMCNSLQGERIWYLQETTNNLNLAEVYSTRGKVVRERTLAGVNYRGAGEPC